MFERADIHLLLIINTQSHKETVQVLGRDHMAGCEAVKCLWVTDADEDGLLRHKSPVNGLCHFESFSGLQDFAHKYNFGNVPNYVKFTGPQPPTP